MAIRFRWAALVVFVILVLGVFYWFQYRPAEIRKDCTASSIERAQRNGKEQGLQKDYYNSDQQQGMYRECLQENGLEG
jgi:uncharacterized ion transporter superfamily protein YfcC